MMNLQYFENLNDCAWYMNGKRQLHNVRTATWTDGKVDPIDIIMADTIDHGTITIVMAIETDRIELFEGNLLDEWSNWDDNGENNIFDDFCIWSTGSREDIFGSFDFGFAAAILDYYNQSCEANGINNNLL